MVHAAQQGDWAQARKRNFQLLDVHPWLYVEGNPVGIKAAMALRGLCANVVRVPLVPLSAANQQRLAAAMGEVR